MKKILLLSVVLLVFIGCFDDPPINRVNLNVPFRTQETLQYCAVACIQMWSLFDGYSWDQDVIAEYVGAPTLPHNAALGINQFTDAVGWPEYESANSVYNQEVCLAYCIASVKDNCPAIIPVNDGTHAVLAKGFQWHEDSNSTPIAEYITYHNPGLANGAGIEDTAGVFKELFDPVQGLYYVIVGYRSAVNDGFNGYNAFLERGGTYYGGGVGSRPKPKL